MRQILILLPLLLVASVPRAAATTIHGTVLRVDGNGLPGATVELLDLPSNYQRQSALLNQNVEATVRASATSAANGRFTLTPPSSGVWQIRVHAEGFVPMSYPMLPAANTLELPPVTLQPATDARIETVDSDQKPLAGIAVVARASSGEIWEVEAGNLWRPASRVAWSDANGQLTLPRARSERLDLRAHRPGHLDVVHQRGVRAARIVFENAPTTTWRVQVVAVKASIGEAKPLPAVISLARPIWPIARTDEHGFATIRGTAPNALYAMTDDGRVRRLQITPASDASSPVVATMAALTTVAGQVLTADGEPIPNALVWPGHSPGSFIHTDVDGTFRLSVPVRRSARLQAHAPGFLPASIRFSGSNALRIELPRATQLSGRVLDVDGRSLAGAQLAAIPEEAGAQPPATRFDTAAARTVSNADGLFELGGLTPGIVYTIAAAKPGFHDTRIRAKSTRDAPHNLEILMSRGRGGSGLVVDGDDRPLAGITVRVASSANQPAEDPTTAVTDDDGRFEVDQLPPPPLDLEARGRDFAPFRVRGIDLPAGSETADLGTLVLLPGVELAGHVTDNDGRALPEAHIWLQSSAQRPGVSTPEKDPDASADDKGRFVLTGLEPDHPVDLRVSAKGYLPKVTRRVVPPTEEPLMIALAQAAEVAGRVVDASGDPIADASVHLAATDPGKASTQSVATDGEGRFEVSEAVPGTLEVSATAEGFQPSKPNHIEAIAGQRLDDIVLELAAGGALAGSITDDDLQPITGAQVRAGRGLGVSAEDGTFEVTGLAPGTLLVEISHSHYNTTRREIEIPLARVEQNFSLQRGQPVDGQVVDTNGLPLAGAELSLESDGASEHSAFSDAEGLFRFAAVPDGAYQLHGRLTGYVETAAEAVTVRGQPVDDVEIRLQAGAVVEGRILGLEFEELARVELVATSASTPKTQAGDVDYEGNYRVENLAPGDWTIRAQLADGGRQAQTRLTLAANTATVQRDLEFGEGLVLSGLVLHGGEAVPETRVTLRGRNVATERSVVTDADGRFQIEDLAEGHYWLAATQPQDRLFHNQEVHLTAPRDLLVEFATAEVSGQVVDATSRAPLTRAMIVLRQQLDSGRPGSAFAVPTEDDGSFLVSRVTAGSYLLEITRDGFQPVRQSLDVASGANLAGLSLAMQPAEGLDLAVSLASGRRPRVVSLHGTSQDGQRFAGARRTSTSGIASFSTLPPGQWQLWVSGTGGAATEIHTTVPGEPLAIVLPNAGRLRVRVPELIPTHSVATVRLLGVDGLPFRALEPSGARIDHWPLNAGQAIVEGVPAGLWTVQVAATTGEIWTTTAATTGGPDVVVSLE